jgi:hypothetical protein
MTVPKIIDKLHAVAETTDAKRVRSLPARLTLAACLDVLTSINAPHEVAAATGQHMDIADVDAALANTELSTDDKIRLKYSLVQHGVLARGRPIGMARI